MKEKALVIESEWSCKFNVGLIKILDQKFRGSDFFKENHDFRASNGLLIGSWSSPEISYDGTYFYVRGNHEDTDDTTVMTDKYDLFCKIINAIAEYNEAMEKKPDYLFLHKKLWMKLAESGREDKAEACREVMKEEGVEKPAQYCFLCEEAGFDSIRVGFDSIRDGFGSGTPDVCKNCKGYWGYDVETCCEKGSYYQMWDNESDIALKKALALRIAFNVKPEHAADFYEVTDDELYITQTEGKIPGIKSYRSRTGKGLRESKEAIEAAMANYNNYKR